MGLILNLTKDESLEVKMFHFMQIKAVRQWNGWAGLAVDWEAVVAMVFMVKKTNIVSVKAVSFFYYIMFAKVCLQDKNSV